MTQQSASVLPISEDGVRGSRAVLTPASANELAAPAFEKSVTLPQPLVSGESFEEEVGVNLPPASPPRVIRIPAIDVEATIIDLGLTDDGSLETPVDFDLAGWWAGGTPASHPGPTVIVGHVDSTKGPAVFFRLRELEPGDEIEVVDDQDNSQTFVVIERHTYDKDAFPTERVYGDTDGPTLRLVTCGGVFDTVARSYESNIVVYAEVAPLS